jgi:hypothetical protein
MKFSSLNLNLNRNKIEKAFLFQLWPMGRNTRAAQLAFACSACPDPTIKPSRPSVAQTALGWPTLPQRLSAARAA